MKYLVLLLLPFTSSGQTVYESISTLQKSYNAFLGKDQASLSIDLIQQHDIGSRDTIYYMMLKVDQKQAETVGYTIGASLFGSNLASGALGSGSKKYVYEKDHGVISLGYDEFIQFYDALNKTYSYINTVKQHRSSKQNSVVTYQYKDVVFGGEYTPALYSTPVTYYIQIGDAVFTIPEQRFTEIAQNVRHMKLVWDVIQKKTILDNHSG